LLLNQFPLLVGQFSPGHAPESSTAFLGFEMSSTQACSQDTAIQKYSC
jgi:hypothetical protein